MIYRGCDTANMSIQKYRPTPPPRPPIIQIEQGFAAPGKKNPDSANQPARKRPSPHTGGFPPYTHQMTMSGVLVPTNQLLHLGQIVPRITEHQPQTQHHHPGGEDLLRASSGLNAQYGDKSHKGCNTELDILITGTEISVVLVTRVNTRQDVHQQRYGEDQPGQP